MTKTFSNFFPDGTFDENSRRMSMYQQINYWIDKVVNDYVATLPEETTYSVSHSVAPDVSSRFVVIVSVTSQKMTLNVSTRSRANDPRQIKTKM